jgi:putative nucleotidyltransferase with HDIG domain
VGEPRGDMWRRRAVLAGLVRLTYLVLPLGLACVASGLLTTSQTVQQLPMAARLLLVVALSTVVLIAAHRALACVLPLAALLEISVAFPGEAPSRFAVARDAGNVAKLREIVMKAQRGEVLIHAGDEHAAQEILALVAALRSHDSRTRGHSERVRVFADLIAEQMQLRPDDRERLRWAALLHDVGKLQVPASVLNKPGKLDDGEWTQIRLHPDTGARLAAPLCGWLGEWARTIPEHHERYDGTGYPRGLAGAQISMGGRILAVADSFEVMTAARSYKQPMPRGEALRELRRFAGDQFDPQVVRAMLAVSVPKLRWAMGPLAWAASTPFALASPTAATVVLQTSAAAFTVGTIGVAGVIAPLTVHNLAGTHSTVAARAVSKAPEKVRRIKPSEVPSPTQTPVASPPTSKHDKEQGTTTGSTSKPEPKKAKSKPIATKADKDPGAKARKHDHRGKQKKHRRHSKQRGGLPHP